MVELSTAWPFFMTVTTEMMALLGKNICIGDEVVFVGSGAVNFAMTRQAAQQTLEALAATLDFHASVTSLDRLRAPEKRVILLVDDEPIIRAWGTGVLEEAGYVVIEARDAQEAMDTLQGGVEVHLVFTDVQMPGALDGLQLAHLVQERWPAIRLLICSGRVALDRQALPAAGRFLKKPYEAEEMLKHVPELVAS